MNQKKLVAGDSVVFLRTLKGELYVGIRRPKGRTVDSPMISGIPFSHGEKETRSDGGHGNSSTMAEATETRARRGKELLAEGSTLKDIDLGIAGSALKMDLKIAHDFDVNSRRGLGISDIISRERENSI